MTTKFSRDQILILRKELRGFSLMPSLERSCRDKHIAKRTTVFKAVTYDQYRNENPIHRLVVEEAIELVAKAGGNVDELLKVETETAIFEEVE